MSDYNNIVKNHLYKAMYDILKMVEKKTISDFCLYISFERSAPGVNFPLSLSPEKQVTIILQNRFWNLKVNQKGFSVTLEFNEKYEVFIPFASIVMFSDPEEEFCLDFRQFIDEEDIEEIMEEDKIIKIDFK